MVLFCLLLIVVEKMKVVDDVHDIDIAFYIFKIFKQIIHLVGLILFQLPLLQHLHPTVLLREVLLPTVQHIFLFLLTHQLTNLLVQFFICHSSNIEYKFHLNHKQTTISKHHLFINYSFPELTSLYLINYYITIIPLFL